MLLSAWFTWAMALSEVAKPWWGTRQTLPIMAEQADASGGARWQELATHMVAGLGLIAAWALLVVGFTKQPSDPMRKPVSGEASFERLRRGRRAPRVSQVEQLMLLNPVGNRGAPVRRRPAAGLGAPKRVRSPRTAGHYYQLRSPVGPSRTACTRRWDSLSGLQPPLRWLLLAICGWWRSLSGSTAKASA
jgi:hypothetical protein